MPVKTPQNRIDKAKRVLVGTGIAIALASVGVAGDFYLNPSVKIAQHSFTPYEYSQIRPQIIQIADTKIGKEPMTYEEYSLLVGTANIEAKKRPYKINTANGVAKGLVEAMKFRETYEK